MAEFRDVVDEADDLLRLGSVRVEVGVVNAQRPAEAIRDRKASAGLRHCPSGRFGANAAWLGAATLAHNLLRWTALLGLGATGELVVAKTMRRTLLGMPGRLTRSGRRFSLHLPAGWPWAPWFELALARLRYLPFPA